MTDDFNLTGAQQAAWRAQLPAEERGVRANIARALAKKGDGKESSWKTRLTHFFNGEESGLRDIFSNPARLEIVADHLGRKPHELRAWLAIAQGAVPVDGPGDVRVPGFEDLGAVPVLAAFYPPPQRQTQFHLPSQGHEHSAAAGLVVLDELVKHASLPLPATGRAVVIVGSPGQGRTPLLKALAARLAGTATSVGPWVPGSVGTGSVVVVRHLDQLGAAERERLIAEVVKSGALLLATTGEADGMMDLPVERIVCALADGESNWAGGYLDHLQALLASRWGRTIDVGPLRQWLDDDPYALGLGVRADTLGFLVRHVADGGRVPVRRGEFLDLALRRWCALLRSAGRTAAALSLEVAGSAALARAAGLAVRARTTGVALPELVRVFADALHDAAGGGGEASRASSIELIDTLLEAGLLLREAGRVRPAQEAVLVAALGRELAGDLHNSGLLRAIVLSQRWHPSLVSAAEEIGDLSPVLAALNELPPATQCLGFAATTRLLVSEVPASDAPALRLAFQRVLWWWAHWKADPRSATMTFGGPSRPEAPKPPEALVGGVAPLIALGMASRIHRRELGGEYTVEGMMAAEQPRPLVDYLALLGRPAPDADTLSLAMLLGAPFQSRYVLDPRWWSVLPGAWPTVSELPGGITRDEYALWWRTVGAPRLAAEPDGDARVAGTAEGWTVTWGMAQTGRGVDVWSKAMVRRCDADDPGAPAAFAEAVVFTLRYGGTANLRGVQAVWAGVRSAKRRHLLRSTAAAAIPRAPSDWGLLEEILVWVLTEITVDSLREELWTAWTAAPPDRARYIPWKAFRKAGLPDASLIDWALATMPEHPRAKGKEFKHLQGTGSQGGQFFQIFQPEDSPQALALDHLVASGGLETLKQLLNAPAEWSRKALERLGREHPDEHRLVLLRAASSMGGQQRLSLLSSLAPRRGEAELWAAVAGSAATWEERLVRWCQVSVAREEDESRWSEAWMALHLLECVVAGPEKGEAPFLEVFGHDDEDGDSDARSDDAAEPREDPKATFQKILAELTPAIDVALADIGMVLGLAWKAGEVGIGDLVNAVFDSEYFRPRVLGGYHHPWWVMAWELLGKEFVVAKLVEGHEDRQNGEATDWRLDALTSGGLFDQAVLPLARHELLGDAAVTVIARRIVGARPDLMQDALSERPLARGKGPNPATVALACRLAQASPDDLVAWLGRRLSPERRPLRTAWWAAVLPSLPMGDARERAVAEWLASRRTREQG